MGYNSLPIMIEQGAGVSVASVSSSNKYACSRHAVTSMSLLKLGVYCNSLGPVLSHK